MDLGLEGRPALVAAASRGLGKASALALAAEGAHVGMCGRDAGALGAARDEIAERTGGTVVAIPADVSTEAGALGFVRRGTEALGGCEILVTNAGGPRTGRFEDLTDEDFRAALDLLFFSTTRMAREAIPGMRRAGFGRIVLISSLSVKEPSPDLILSSSVRSAVSGWAKTLADEVAPDGVTVNAVLPGRVWTERVRGLIEAGAKRSGRTEDEERAAEEARIPVGRFGDPSEVGAAVAFLSSTAASYITGTSVLVDGGLHRAVW